MDYSLKLKAEKIKEELKNDRKLEIEREFGKCLGLLSSELTEEQMTKIDNILRLALIDKIHAINFEYDKLL